MWIVLENAVLNVMMWLYCRRHVRQINLSNDLHLMYLIGSSFIDMCLDYLPHIHSAFCYLEKWKTTSTIEKIRQFLSWRHNHLSFMKDSSSVNFTFAFLQFLYTMYCSTQSGQDTNEKIALFESDLFKTILLQNKHYLRCITCYWRH